MEIERAPLPTANLFSSGDHFTQVAARLIRNTTSDGFQSFPSRVHTYALRSYNYQIHNPQPNILHYCSTYSTTGDKSVSGWCPVHSHNAVVMLGNTIVRVK